MHYNHEVFVHSIKFNASVKSTNKYVPTRMFVIRFLGATRTLDIRVILGSDHLSGFEISEGDYGKKLRLIQYSTIDRAGL